MADIHKDKFLMTGKAYNEGWERIFGKKKTKKKKTPKVKNGVQS
jgi:hypothetical protein